VNKILNQVYGDGEGIPFCHNSGTERGRGRSRLFAKKTEVGEPSPGRRLCKWPFAHIKFKKNIALLIDLKFCKIGL
jgi:hypothetical protein